MAYSGTRTFNLTIEEIIEEAFERCGLEVRSGYDLKTGLIIKAEHKPKKHRVPTCVQSIQRLTKYNLFYRLMPSNFLVGVNFYMLRFLNME